jgi:hypothetical protein
VNNGLASGTDQIRKRRSSRFVILIEVKYTMLSQGAAGR